MYNKMKPRVSAIAGIGKNRELGKNGDLIWRNSRDLKRLKEITMGHPIIMGRKTYESIGRPLPGRINIIVTRDQNYVAEGCTIVHSIEEALEHAGDIEGREIFIFGGAEIYEKALPYIDRIYLTLFNAEDNAADTFFPEFSEFDEVVDEGVEESDDDDQPYNWVILEKGSTTPRVSEA